MLRRAFCGHCSTLLKTNAKPPGRLLKMHHQNKTALQPLHLQLAVKIVQATEKLQRSTKGSPSRQYLFVQSNEVSQAVTQQV